MYQKILVPLDGSDLAEGVLPHVKEVARRFEAEVALLQAVPSISQILLETSATTMEGTAATAGLGMDMAEEQHEASKQAAQSYLDSLAANLKAEGLKVSQHLVEGAPATAIIEFLHASGADLIAMSTHGRGGLGRLVFGSVTDEVLRHAAHTPLLLIRASD